MENNFSYACEEFIYTFRVDKDFIKEAQKPNADFWGAACLLVGSGENERCVAEYNYCIDGDTSDSAIYKVYRNVEENCDLITTEHWQHYEVDINDPEWKFNLFKAMVNFHQEYSRFMA